MQEYEYQQISWDTSSTDFFQAKQREGGGEGLQPPPDHKLSSSVGATGLDEGLEEQLLWQSHSAPTSRSPILGEPIPIPPPSPELSPSPQGASLNTGSGGGVELPVSVRSYEEMEEEVCLLEMKTSQPMFVHVTDPKKEGSGTDVHIDYMIKISKSRDGGYEPPAEEGGPVRRRFRDFVWLDRMLRGRYMQCIIPPLPHKYRLEYLKGGRFDADFVEKRRKSLERYLTRICRHPVLQRDESLRIFLREDNLTMAKHTFTLRDDETLFDNISDSLLNAFTSIRKPDQRYIDIFEAVLKLEESLMSILNISLKLTKQENELEAELKILAAAAVELGVLDEAINKPTSLFAQKLDAFAVALKEKGTRRDEEYLMLIHEYLAYCQRLKQILKLRDQKQIDFEELSELLWQAQEERRDIRQRRNPAGGGLTGYLKGRYDSMTGADQERARAEKLVNLDSKIKELEQAVEESNDISVLFSRETLREYGLFRVGQGQDFKFGFEDYINAHLKFYKQGMELWESFIEQMEEFKIVE